jgi:TonB family protein
LSKIRGPMETGAQRAREPFAPPAAQNKNAQTFSFDDSTRELIELPPHGRLPRLDLGIDWESPWREFRTSVAWLFTGQRPPKDSELAKNSHLRIHWIGGRNSGWAFAASSVWHAVVVVLLLLPIWGFLPATAGNLAPIRVELNMAAPEDLPPIHLAAPAQPAPGSKRNALPTPKLQPNEPPAQDGADAFHPRQTILSIPVRITHPRQTLIQPAAPMAAPKIEPELPNIVQWAANVPPPKLRLQLSQSAAAPKMRARAADNSVAPDVANAEKNAGPLNIAASPVVNSAPHMPMMPMAAAAPTGRKRADVGGAAPEVGAQNGDASLHNVIALSASPAPPAPEVAVPQGNLAARIAISPSGTQHGVPGGTGSAASGSVEGGAAGGSGNGASGAGTGTGGSASGAMPAAVSVSGGSSHASVAGGGGLAGQSRSKLILQPTISFPAKPEMNPRRGPANVADLSPNDPPEKILSGKEVYRLDVNLPDLTSASGSWILNFAQLDEGTPFDRPKGTLSGPVPMITVDPKYPPDAIKENIEGEVVLYAIIRANGSVDSIQLVRKLDPRLDKNAVEALAQWKFRPAAREGKPVDVEAVVHIPFKYHPPAP